MFTEDMYMRVKSEKHYTMLFNIKTIKDQGGWNMQTRISDEMAKLDYFQTFDDKPVDKLRTRMSISETIAKLLVEIEKLNVSLTECTEMLQQDTKIEMELLQLYNIELNKLTNFRGSLLLWLRFELAGRIYASIRDLSRVDFATGNSAKIKESLKTEACI